MVFQTDGNVVEYSGNSALWDSNTVSSYPNELVFQTDGNLVLYGPAKSSLVFDKVPPDRATMDINHQSCRRYTYGCIYGYVSVPGVGKSAYWNTGTYGNPGAYLRMQDDANLVIYRADGSALWSTR